MDEDRLIDIETKLAYQEQTIKELSDVIYNQQREIDQLKTVYKNLAIEGQELKKSILGTTPPADEKPPHY